MLKIVAVVNNRRTLFLGLARTNTERLHDDQPIVVDSQAIGGIEVDGFPCPIQDIVLLAGESLADVHAQLIAAGLPLPPFEDTPTVYRRQR